jgi:hypothetical protein
MITDAEIAKFAIVCKDIFLELNNPRIVFEVIESLNESSIEFDDLRKGESSMCGLVKASSGLNDLECFVIGGVDSDGEEGMVNHIEESFNGIASSQWISIFLNQFRWDGEGHAEFDNSAGPKLVRVEIIHAAGDDFQVGIGIPLECTQCHHSHASY